MKLRSVSIAVLALLVPLCAKAQSDEEKLVREYAATLGKDRDAKDRADAAHWLGGRKSPEAVSALAKALSDPEASVREAAASALWDTGEAAAAAKPELQKALGDRNAAVLARVAGALHSMDVPQAELADAWRRSLAGAHDETTAFLAARGLVGLDPPETLAPPILTYLANKAREAEHPRTGRSSLGDRDRSEAAGKALERLLAKDAAPVVPLLGETVRETPESGRYVLGALASVKTLPPGTLDLALASMTSRVASTRYAALALAGRLRSERDAARWIPEATRLLADPDQSVRLEACGVLKGMKGLSAPAAPELVRLLETDPDMSVRTRAAEALGEIGDASNPVPKASRISVAAASKDALARAMKDENSDLATAALGAYNVLSIDSGEIVAALAEVAVSGPDVAARQKALLCLRNRQGQAKVALASIRPLMQAPEKLGAEDARTAVEWIERGGAGSPSPISAGGPASAAAAAPAPAGRSSAPPAASSSEASAGAEARGLAVLRQRSLEFDEPSFYRALSEADAEAIRAYLDGGMPARHVFAGDNGRSPLMILFFGRQACAKGAEGRELAALLIQRGADVNAVDEKKNTALMFAADQCDRETIRLLLKAGAQRDAKNWSGLTALQMGIVSGNPGLEELIAAGSRLDPATAKAYADAYKSNPKALALIQKATAPR